MGMYAKLRHVTVTELKAVKKKPAKFYRDLYGLKGKVPDRSTLLRDLGQQLGAAIIASPFGKELTEMPETRRVADAMLQHRAPDLADQQAAAQKMMELLPKINFRPTFSHMLPNVIEVPQGLELEKSWHCLHFMFSGKVWEAGNAPIEKAILGGTEIPDAEGVMGYGPARYLERGDVQKIAAALGRYPIKRKAFSFDTSAAKAAKIYCANHRPEELVHYFNLLKEYYREAVSVRHAMLLWFG